MRAQIVEHDHRTGPPLGHEHLFDVEQERLAIDGPGQVQGGQWTVQAQRADDAHVVAPVARSAGKGARAHQAARVGACHGAVAAALVDEHQITRGHARQPRGPRGAQGLHPLALALVGVQGLLFFASGAGARASG